MWRKYSPDERRNRCGMQNMSEKKEKIQSGVQKDRNERISFRTFHCFPMRMELITSQEKLDPEHRGAPR
jgi:hypothetical protein